MLSKMLRRSGIPLSPAVRANGFVFVRGDIVLQTEVSLRKCRARAAGGGLLAAKVVKVTIYCANAAYYASVNEACARFFGEAPPARTFVAVASWPMPFDIEIEVVALA